MQTFTLVAITTIRLPFLHQTGSNSPLGLHRNTDTFPFHAQFTAEYILGDANLYFPTHRVTSLAFKDILPEDPKLYDKMRPPKKDGRPTVVHFHVTVMGLDSIDENAMVIHLVLCMAY